jgi:dTDP-glucose 4,6-dehydratase
VNNIIGENRNLLFGFTCDRLMKKVVYITGCLGFIGIHVTKKCLDLGWYVIGVDKITYVSNVNFLEDFQKYPNFKFIQSDINDLDRIYDCDYVVNIAAESHVDNSILSSDLFLRSNINGVHHLLKIINDKKHNTSKKPIFLHFSTDEVYGDIEYGSHTEQDLLKPSNPYSATKAAADMLVLAWSRTFNIPYVIVRPTNNYGIGQYVEKLIPKSIKYLSIGRKIDLHNNGTPKRTWLHADDTADAIITIINNGVTNEIFNISGNYEIDNLSVVKNILKFYDDIEDYRNYIEDFTRPGQDVRYSINDSKLRSLGWQPKANFERELAKIVEYYKNNFVW